MRFGILTMDIANKLFYNFQMFTLKNAPVIQEYLHVAFFFFFFFFFFYEMSI